MQGLQNLGSTCAVNSLIQIICREPKLRNTILETNPSDDTLLGNLKEIIHLMYNENKSLVPGKFIGSLFKSMDGIFRMGEQIDIGELWVFLFDKITTEIHQNPHLTKILECNMDETHIKIDENLRYTDEETYNKQLQNKYEQMYCKFNENKSSKWLETCQGFYINTIQCEKCKYSTHNFEPFTTLLLDIPDDVSCPSVTSMLRTYLKEEVVTDEWKCEKCNFNTYRKDVKLWKLPDVLFFIVKRFGNNGMKNTKEVHINKNICFKKGTILHDKNVEKTFVISSFGMHYGQMINFHNGGHYSAICNIEDVIDKRKEYENMVLYDDINISKIPKENFMKYLDKNKDAYMIVYSTV